MSSRLLPDCYHGVPEIRPGHLDGPALGRGHRPASSPLPLLSHGVRESRNRIMDSGTSEFYMELRRRNMERSAKNREFIV